MILINHRERETLERAGALKSKIKVKGGGFQDANYTVVNKRHKSKNKRTYVTETPDILLFLEKYDGLNLQKIRHDQLAVLKKEGLVTEELIQRSGEYNPTATVYINSDGQIYCKKITSYMFAIGIWKKNVKKG